MAHGKFEGSVTTVDHGKTYHATYADGQRKGRWNTGPAVAKAENVEPEPAAKERPEPASSTKTSATTERIESQQPKVAEPTTEAPAEGPHSARRERGFPAHGFLRRSGLVQFVG